MTGDTLAQLDITAHTDNIGDDDDEDDTEHVTDCLVQLHIHNKLMMC